MNGILEQAINLYSLTECVLVPVERHEDGRNQLFIVRRNGENQYVLRVSALDTRRFRPRWTSTATCIPISSRKLPSS